MRVKRLELSSIQKNIIVVSLYAMIFIALYIGATDNELIFSVLVGSAFFIGGLIGILTRTLAFLPILSDFVGLKDYDKKDELMFSIGILINTFTLFIGIAMLINVFIELL